MSIDQTEYVVMISKESCTIIFKFNDNQGRGICARAWCHLSFKENKLILWALIILMIMFNREGPTKIVNVFISVEMGFGYRAWQY